MNDLKQLYLCNSIRSNKIKDFKRLLNDPEVNISENNQEAFMECLKTSDEDNTIFTILIYHPKVDITARENLAVYYASIYNSKTRLETLLSFEEVDPSVLRNWAISEANASSLDDIVDILWSHQKVKDSLKEDHPDLYNQLIQKDIAKKIKDFS